MSTLKDFAALLISGHGGAVVVRVWSVSWLSEAARLAPLLKAGDTIRCLDRRDCWDRECEWVYTCT